MYKLIHYRGGIIVLMKNKDNFYNLQENCIEIIEKEINIFFVTRMKLVLSLNFLCFRRTLKPQEEFFTLLKLSNNEIENLIQSIDFSLRREIYNSNKKSIIDSNINIDKYLLEMKQQLLNNMNFLLKTEKIIGINEFAINNFISVMISTISNGNIVGNLLEQYNYSGNILNYYGLKKQQRKHGELIRQQMIGLLINLKTDLRNEFVNSALSLIITYHNIYEDSFVA